MPVRSTTGVMHVQHAMRQVASLPPLALQRSVPVLAGIQLIAIATAGDNQSVYYTGVDWGNSDAQLLWSDRNISAVQIDGGKMYPTCVAVADDNCAVFVGDAISQTLIAYSKSVGVPWLTPNQQKVHQLVGDPAAIACTPDGLSVFVVCDYSATIFMFDRIPRSRTLSLSPYGSYGSIFMGLSPAAGMVCDDLALFLIGGSGDFYQFSRPPALSDLTFVAGSNYAIRAQPGPRSAFSGIAISRDGLNVYITDQGANRLLIFSRVPGTAITAFVKSLYFPGPNCVRVSRDDKYIFIGETSTLTGPNNQLYGKVSRWSRDALAPNNLTYIDDTNLILDIGSFDISADGHLLYVMQPSLGQINIFTL